MGQVVSLQLGVGTRRLSNSYAWPYFNANAIYRSLQDVTPSPSAPGCALALVGRSDRAGFGKVLQAGTNRFLEPSMRFFSQKKNQCGFFFF